MRGIVDFDPQPVEDIAGLIGKIEALQLSQGAPEVDEEVEEGILVIGRRGFYLAAQALKAGDELDLVLPSIPQGTRLNFS